MASLWKHPASKYWTACFTDIHGRRCKRTTKTTDRRRAQKIANEFEAAARAKRTAQQSQKVIADLHKMITGESLTAISLRDFVQTWLAMKEPETAATTIAFYRGSSSHFVSFLGNEADASIVEITRKQITNFRNAEAKELAAKTVNHYLKSLRMIFKAAKRDGLIAEDPTEFVDTVKQRGDRAEKRAFTIPEIKAVLSVADDEWRSMVVFGLYTGQRLGDIAKLTWQNIDTQRGEIRLTTSKTGKRMIIPFRSSPLRKHIESLPAGDKPDALLHPRIHGLKNMSGGFATVLEQAGLREKKTHQKKETNGRRREMDTSGLSFHSLRHTVVSLGKAAGIPAAAVMEFVGHDSEQMSELYTHVGDTALDEMAASLPDIL